MSTLIPVLLLAALIGFAAHRASLCTVRAMTELMSSGTAHMLASFVRASCWAALVYGVLLLALPASGGAGRIAAIDPPALALVGALVFGFGAAINGACSYSTLQRIADGELWGLATLAGMAVGMAGWSLLNSALAIASVGAIDGFWSRLSGAALWLVAGLALLAAIELLRLWRSRRSAAPSWRALLAPQYRIASAAAVMGTAGGALYALHGAWSYPATLRRAVESGLGSTTGPAAIQLGLAAALFGGMWFSAVQRGSFRLRLAPDGKVWPRLVGGAAMGVGASLVPGGNDTLILVAIPALSPWAVPAYLAMLAGVALGLTLLRWRRQPLPQVSCDSGYYVEAGRR
jgi:uncharacterized protein